MTIANDRIQAGESEAGPEGAASTSSAQVDGLKAAPASTIGDAPAFPVTWPDQTPERGMTLRQWYAGQALIGILQVPDLRPGNVEEMQHLATRVFQVADAMVSEGAKPGGDNG